MARFRLDLKIVCEESAKMNEIDYHDYPDSIDGIPCHFATLKCKRCGKGFII